jgi:hypothetical protein
LGVTARGAHAAPLSTTIPGDPTNETAAEVLAGRPQAMRLRYPQTLSNIAGDRTNTIVFPMPGELMNLMMRGTKSGE